MRDIQSITFTVSDGSGILSTHFCNDNQSAGLAMVLGTILQ